MLWYVEAWSTMVACAFRHCSIATFYIVPTVWLPSFWATACFVWTTQRRIRNRWDRSWWPFWWHGSTHFGLTWWTWWHGETLFGDGMVGLFAIFLFNREVTGQVVYQFVWHLSTFVDKLDSHWKLKYQTKQTTGGKTYEHYKTWAVDKTLKTNTDLNWGVSHKLLLWR